MKLLVYEVLDQVEKLRSNKEKVEFLRKHDTGALRDVLRGSLDDRIVWLLPDTPPPYKPNRPESVPSSLVRECVNLAYFVKGGKGPNMSQGRREKMFIGLLEAIHPKDASLVIDMVAKKAPKSVNYKLVKEAFPDLLP